MTSPTPPDYVGRRRREAPEATKPHPINDVVLQTRDGVIISVFITSDDQICISGPEDSALIPISALIANHATNGPAGESVRYGKEGTSDQEDGDVGVGEGS